MRHAIQISTISSVLLFGAAFGFFYAWICSTMWAFDAMDPRAAISAMQAVNEHVRNMVFFPVFFLTPFVAWIAAFCLFKAEQTRPAFLFAAAGLIYLIGGLGLTMLVHIPMNDALGAVIVPENREEAQAIWSAYSPDWQFWNATRTIICGLCLAIAGCGLLKTSEHLTSARSVHPVTL